MQSEWMESLQEEVWPKNRKLDQIFNTTALCIFAHECSYGETNGVGRLLSLKDWAHDALNEVELEIMIFNTCLQLSLIHY